MAEKKYSFYGDEEVLDARLAVEIGRGYMVLAGGAGGWVSGLEYYETDDSSLEDILSDIRHQSTLLNNGFSETKVYLNLPESVLVPAARFNTSVAADIVDLAFGPESQTRVNVENINTAPAIVNVYRSPDDWQDIIQRHFRSVTRRHLHTKLAEDVVAAGDSVILQVCPGEIVVAAAGKKMLKIVTRFPVTGDTDILYHLANVCKQVDVDIANTTVRICGLVDADGTVSRLLQRHFRIRFDAVSSDMLPAEASRYPAHYFSAVINLLA